MGIMEFLGSVGAAIGAVLSLNPDAIEWIWSDPDRLAIAVTVAILAGASLMLGDSVILYLNRLRGWRFALTLLLNGVGLALLYAVQAGVIVLIGPWIAGYSPGLELILTGAMLATAPLVFGMFVLIPYFGPGIAVCLQVWAMVALWMINGVLFATDRWTALWITLLAWLCMQVLSRAFATPVARVGDWIWRLISGRPSMITASDLLSGHLFLPLEQRFSREAAL